jgi:L-2-hydroxyglutarate oxidase LhgO
VASNAHLGVHVTVDMAGQIRFGPDVSWIDGVDYSFDSSREPLFYEAIRKYYPVEGRPAAAGIYRYPPQGVRPERTRSGFRHSGTESPRGRRLVNLYGIESPRTDRILAIAAHVSSLLQG